MTKCKNTNGDKDPRGYGPRTGGTHHGGRTGENTCPICDEKVGLLPNHLPDCPGETNE